MSRILFFLVFFIVAEETGAQIHLATLAGKNGYQIERVVRNDSILLAVSKSMQGAAVNTELYWIGDQGLTPASFIRRNSDEVLVGVDFDPDKNQYLYFSTEGKKNKTLLNIYKSQASTFSSQPAAIPLPGILIGTYPHVSGLTALVLEKETQVLRVIRLKGNEIADEKIIKIPFKLKSFRNSDITFINTDFEVELNQSFSKVKFLKAGDWLNLLIDEPYMDFVENQQPPFRTSLFQHNLKNDSTQLHVFLEFSNATFRSYLVDNYLLRATFAKDGNRLTVSDIRSQKYIFDQPILPKEELETRKGYHRIGRDFILSKALLRMSPVLLGTTEESAPVVVGEKVNGKFIATAGWFSNVKGQSHFLLANPAALLYSLANEIIIQSREKPGTSSYTYFVGDLSGNLSQSNEPTYYKKEIDDYEYSLPADHFTFKTYIGTSNSSVMIYGTKASNDLTIYRMPKGKN